MARLANPYIPTTEDVMTILPSQNSAFFTPLHLILITLVKSQHHTRKGSNIVPTSHLRLPNTAFNCNINGTQYFNTPINKLPFLQYNANCSQSNAFTHCQPRDFPQRFSWHILQRLRGHFACKLADPMTCDQSMSVQPINSRDLLCSQNANNQRPYVDLSTAMVYYLYDDRCIIE